MSLWILKISLWFLLGTATCTLSPPTDKHRRDKGKVESKKGPVNQNVFDRGLVVQEPKPIDILRESGLYYKDTNFRQFTGEVLGYITPVIIFSRMKSRMSFNCFIFFSPNEYLKIAVECGWLRNI
uniref:Chid1 protein n=1 Tax=Fopius arisanus TaxID=64838 RepID=A0A0C9RDH8_9HYME